MEDLAKTLTGAPHFLSKSAGPRPIRGWSPNSHAPLYAPTSSKKTFFKSGKMPLTLTLTLTHARPAFNTPAGDVVATPDTPTRRPSRHVSTTRRSLSTLDPPADAVTLVRHSRMFSRRASTARKARNKPGVHKHTHTHTLSLGRGNT